MLDPQGAVLVKRRDAVFWSRPESGPLAGGPVKSAAHSQGMHL